MTVQVDTTHQQRLTDHYVSELVARVSQHFLGDSLVKVADEQSTCCLVVELVMVRLRRPKLAVFQLCTHTYGDTHHLHQHITDTFQYYFKANAGHPQCQITTRTRPGILKTKPSTIHAIKMS